jgi:hypothetical protein
MLRSIIPFLLFAVSASASVITGHVTGPDGIPVAGATVWLAQEASVQRTETTDVGGYSFGNVVVGPMQLVAFRDGLALGGTARFAVGDGEENITLGEAGDMHLKVDAPRGQGAVPGARVSAIYVNNAFTVPVEELIPHGFPQWRSGDDGVLHVGAMPSGGFAKISLKHVDYADTYVDFVPVRDRPTVVTMDAGVRVGGRVTDGAKGIRAAKVTIFQLGTGGQREFARTTTDREGLFAVRLAPGEYFAAARHPDWASPAPVSLRVLQEDIEAGDITLLKPYRLHGSVVFPDGKPCAGARVTYREKDTIFDDTYTGSDGAFAIKAASPSGILRIGAPAGYQTEILSDIKVNLGEKRDVKVDPVKLKKLPAIAGRVTMEDGSPGAHVLVASLNVPQGLWMITDEDGKFSFQVNADPDVEEVQFLAEHAERFQRAQFAFSLKSPKPVEVKLASYSPDEVQPDVAVGTNDLSEHLDQKAPDFTCSAWFNGGAITRDSLKGKVAVLLFWAGFDTTIEGVNKLEQTRALMELLKDDQQISFLALHDCTSEAGEVESFVKRAGLSCPVGLDAEPMVTFGAFHVTFIPEVLLLDKSGNLRYFQPGPRILEFIKVLKRRAD